MLTDQQKPQRMLIETVKKQWGSRKAFFSLYVRNFQKKEQIKIRKGLNKLAQLWETITSTFVHPCCESKKKIPRRDTHLYRGSVIFN